jgi:hypothetical protein
LASLKRPDEPSTAGTDERIPKSGRLGGLQTKDVRGESFEGQLKDFRLVAQVR